MAPLRVVLAVLVSALAAGAAARPAAAEPVEQRVTLPLFGRTLAYRIPAHYAAQTPQYSERLFLIEYLREGETFADWTTLLTVRGFRGFGGLPRTTQEIARAIYEPRKCPTGPIFEAAPPETTADGIEVTYLAIGCAATPADAYAEAQAGSGEIDVIALYRDAENLYSVQYAVRGDSFRDGKPPLALADARATLARVFGAVTLKPTPAPTAQARR
ncbi:hypothetical protein [Novosphingobium huizhouense]|uniref:hypothetical protein n=1 Tax=Novosphingobium huizhouense TaxID=2866625 RepID=UPI001CD8EB42|nr:hypothetical protein [Novosphingobium huizhouense]